MNILLFGDVVGRPGREALKHAVPKLKKKYKADFVIANGENAAHGFGITPDTIAEMEAAGVDAFTAGNHVWKNSKGVEMLVTNPKNIVCPANFPGEEPGRGFTKLEINGVEILLINLQGQVFIDDEVSSPFIAFDQIHKEHGADAITIVDFHAEATGEKRIMGWHIDGRASILVGTHTHVQTADEQILPQGTAYITDLGMSGAVDSSLGMDKHLVAQKVVQGIEISLEPPSDPIELMATGIFVQVDNKTKLAKKIERFDHRSRL